MSNEPQYADAKRDVGPIGAAAARVEEALDRAANMAEMLGNALRPVLMPEAPKPGENLRAMPASDAAPLGETLDRLGYRLEALGDHLADLRHRVAL